MAKTTTKLTQEDIFILKKQIRNLYFIFPGFCIIASILFNFIGNEYSNYLIIFTIVISIIGFVFAYYVFTKEIKAGIKNIYVGTVTKKEIRQDGSIKNKEATYHLIIDGDDVQITFADYDKFSEGQKLELHITESSSTLLKLVNL